MSRAKFLSSSSIGHDLEKETLCPGRYIHRRENFFFAEFSKETLRIHNTCLWDIRPEKGKSNVQAATEFGLQARDPSRHLCADSGLRSLRHPVAQISGQELGVRHSGNDPGTLDEAEMTNKNTHIVMTVGSGITCCSAPTKHLTENL
jgi:hypothetical protein